MRRRHHQIHLQLYATNIFRLLKNNFMRRLVTLLFLISICYQVCAQKAIFVRVYNLNDKKINKGHVLATTDTSLQLITNGRNTVNLSINSIGKIKTKRSAGNNFLVGSLVVASAAAIVGAATYNLEEDDLPGGIAALVGLVWGLPVGAAIGGISVPFKKSKTFVINGNIEKLKAFQSYITERNN